MLGTIREKLLSWGAKILFGLLILSFGIWGIQGYLRAPNPSTTAVATVGSIDIPGETLKREVDLQLARFQRMLGTNLDIEQAKSMGIVDAALETLVQRDLVALGARDLGLLVNDNIVSADIRADPRFRGPLGDFDRNQFARFLQNIGENEDSYVRSLRDDLLRRQYLSPVEIGALAPDALVEPVFRRRNERRVAEVLRLDDSKMTGIGEPDESQIEKFHTDHAQTFTAPEFRALTLAELKSADLVPEIDIPEADIKSEYEARMNEYRQPEKRQVQQILVSDEATARKAEARLKEGADFATVAKEVAGLDPATIDLGEVTRADLPIKELADAVFALGPDSVSKPIHTTLGWHVVRVGKITPEHTRTLSEVHDELRKRLAQDKAIDAVYDLSNKFQDALGGGASIEEAARKLNVKVRKIAAVSSAGTDRADKPVTGLDKAGTILRTAFETGEGEESDLTDLGDAGYFILRVDKVTPPALRPLTEVRDKVIAAWKQAERAKAAEAKAKAYAERIKAGTPIAEIAKEAKADLIKTKPFLRDGSGLKTRIPGALISDLFKLKVAGVATAPGADAHFVAWLEEIVPATPSEEPAALKAAKGQLGQSLTNDLVAELTRALRDRHGVTVNHTVIGKLF